MSYIVNSDASRIALTVGVGVGVVSVTIGLAYLYKKKLEYSPPKKWRRVGELSELIVYPIKSCAPVRVSKINCSLLGVEDGYLRDRVFVVTDLNGHFQTARAYPNLLSIQPTIIGDKLQLSAPGMLNFELDIPHLYTIAPMPITIWKDSLKTVDCGEEVAKWISRFIFSEDTKFRLMFYPDRMTTRNIASYKPQWKHLQISQADSGGLHDATSYSMINASSIADLNTRLDNAVLPLQYRPNFVVKGPLAYEEDNWKWIKIGTDVVLKKCILTNINPETAERSPSFQPLKTLSGYRKLYPKESPVMGIHLGIRIMGKVNLGDPVYVEDESS